MTGSLARNRVTRRRFEPVAAPATDGVSFRAARGEASRTPSGHTVDAPMTVLAPYPLPAEPTGVAIVPFALLAVAPSRSRITDRATSGGSVRAVLVAICLALIVSILSLAGPVNVSLAATGAAQASATSEGVAPPRLQAVGEGNAIVSGQVDQTDASDDGDGTGGYRIAVGIAVAALILFGLFQRRQGDTPGGPDRPDRPAGGRRPPIGRAVGH
ncbi:MAG TPA: hypothetical protein VGT61_08730 [Thermomicrobiales bacterium]|jgi:hypothetical protein|nr:hypothetical protein [Thermomicrobiales bacterium]